jgi:hypothetical protein
MSGVANVRGLIQPIWRPNSQAEKVLVTVNAIHSRRNKWVKKK